MNKPSWFTGFAEALTVVIVTALFLGGGWVLVDRAANRDAIPHLEDGVVVAQSTPHVKMVFHMENVRFPDVKKDLVILLNPSFQKLSKREREWVQDVRCDRLIRDGWRTVKVDIIYKDSK